MFCRRNTIYAYIFNIIKIRIKFFVRAQTSLYVKIKHPLKKKKTSEKQACFYYHIVHCSLLLKQLLFLYSYREHGRKFANVPETPVEAEWS